MKAKEAAELVAKDISKGIPDILALMPDYPNPLHRRQWISTFLKSLPQGLQPNYRQGLLDSQK